MRIAMVAIFALSAVAAVTVGSPTPASAYEYPYCAQGKGFGVPGDCSYSSYDQCLAAASGRGLYCAVNPRVAYNHPPRRGRYYREY